MKAAVLKSFGSPLTIENVPDPVPGTGEVIVDVVATRVLSYANEVFSGMRNYALDLPVIPGPGGVGRVRAIGPDATKLAVGDWVMCDPTVRSRDDAMAPDITLQGWSARDEGGMRLQKHFRHGSFAEQMMVPTENVKRLGAITAAEATQWCALGTLLVPYGGLLAANLQPGETVLVSGATGNFGSAAVAVALAMGAACVVAPGRNDKVLADLVRRFGDRVRTVKLSGNESDDGEQMKRAAPGPIDVVFDIMPPSVSTNVVRAAIMTVRPYGRVVLMGGVGMAGGAGLELPYPWIMRNCVSIHGVWMYPPDAATRLIALVRAGLLRLEEYEAKTFDLDHANEAVAYAAANAGPFKMTVLKP
ncbi:MULTISPECIES: zinc-binding alcohol dehydrogenase family protein [unclassified Bradyrhizobium]|uniref:zinc-binding alcohol dehydrogenase family protein n=1 Tax=unclassified Bradyrhizobium TaxID=2631580 RepID=UPI002479FA45|nr:MULTISPECIES: zinc-binding alcohol dehydrogenase family protein [unclassified Bradyrhizobium]WGR74834.1 zinc-binding alcohol dehydrogenase family protein [Bradyrhizobium sp. ISRA426]WGR79670.1 zinc-binding alcohol dehydrogenase family protein [Bradyrhizobium sp. ISRA430]WGR90006.1 zinc-binding alcohol dehydrogenase family protein [Bradyrhizobium sp. ISRA432]